MESGALEGLTDFGCGFSVDSLRGWRGSFPTLALKSPILCLTFKKENFPCCPE